MGRISIELVPRQKNRFIEELQIVRKHFPSVDTINIPDIQRYEINSLEAARFGKKVFASVIPHLRAVAVDRRAAVPYKKFLIDNEISEVLIVLGDEPASSSKNFHPSNTLEV
ncbi:MAG: methylenetetrahydrofolate reductase, partial [Candidatus Omnitrophota bacterium]